MSLKVTSNQGESWTGRRGDLPDGAAADPPEDPLRVLLEQCEGVLALSVEDLHPRVALD